MRSAGFIPSDFFGILLAQSSWSYPWYNLPLEPSKGFKVPFFYWSSQLAILSFKIVFISDSLCKKKSWMKQNLHIFIFVPNFKDFSEETQKKGWLHFVESTSSICCKRKVDQTDFFISLLKDDKLYKSIFTFADCLKTALPLQSVWWGS